MKMENITPKELEKIIRGTIEEATDLSNLLKEFHSKKYYDEAKTVYEESNRVLTVLDDFLLEKYNLDPESIEGDVPRDAEVFLELRAKLIETIESLEKSIKEHEEYINEYLAEYAATLDKFVKGVLTGKIPKEEKKKKSLFDKILELIEPKPRDVEKLSRKIARDIYKENLKKLEKYSYSDCERIDDVERAIEEIEEIEFSPKKEEVTREYLLANYKKIIMKDFMPDEKKLLGLYNQLVDMRSKIQVYGGDVGKAEESFQVTGLKSLLEGAISFDDFVAPFLEKYLDDVSGGVKKELEKYEKKFREEKEKLLDGVKKCL